LTVSAMSSILLREMVVRLVLFFNDFSFFSSFVPDVDFCSFFFSAKVLLHSLFWDFRSVVVTPSPISFVEVPPHPSADSGSMGHFWPLDFTLLRLIAPLCAAYVPVVPDRGTLSFPSFPSLERCFSLFCRAK